MAYNAQSIAQGQGVAPVGAYNMYQSGMPFSNGNSNPFSSKYQQSGYNPYANFSQQVPSTMPTDQYAGNPYTGSEVYAPPLADPDEYWNNRTSGYDQMPEYGDGAMPYDYNIDPSAESMLGSDATDFWENANTYAPWSGYSPGGNQATAWELANQPGFSATGGNDAVGYNFGSMDPTHMYDTSSGMGNEAQLANAFGPLAGFLGMKKKKRPSYNFTAPSYQGHMFTPEEGFPEYYNPSQETQNETQQEIYQQQLPVTSVAGNTGSYDYNYTGGTTQDLQSYVGQQDQNYGSLYGEQNNNLYSTFKPGEFNG